MALATTPAQQLAGFAAAILRSPKQAIIEDELAGRKPRSQVQRILERLGIRSIPGALTPSKGSHRASPANLSDRLRKEMRRVSARN